MTANQLLGSELKQLFRAANQVLTEKKAEIDALNVFPVPDGDTGTNMSLTFQAALEQIEQVNSGSAALVAQAAAQGSLMGARGNSGVILSQLLRGFSLSVTGKEALNARDLAEALQSGVDTAYLGVKKPVEGTILTVARIAANSAVEAAAGRLTDSPRRTKSPDIIAVLEAACTAGQAALENTPNQLAILKQVGVVDAGGMGWLLILQGFLRAALGRDDELETKSAQRTETDVRSVPETEAQPRNLPELSEDIQYQYCTEFILKGTNLDEAKLRNNLEPLGDSLLVVGGPGALKVHLHSNHPGEILELCLNHGTLHDIHISNMVEQAAAAAGDRALQAKPIGVAAVANGDGLKQILISLGVDVVIEGGQTSNPSTSDIVEAARRINAEQIILLPNNGNIVLAAQQAGSVLEGKLKVIPTRSIPQGIAALVAYAPDGPLERNLETMTAAADQVITVEVTYAVRESRWDNREIKQGDILGLVDDQVTVIGQNVKQVVLEVLEKALTPESELVTLYYGLDTAVEAAESLAAELAAEHPSVDFEVHFGGQPLYYYLISVE